MLKLSKPHGDSSSLKRAVLPSAPAPVGRGVQL